MFALKLGGASDTFYKLLPNKESNCHAKCKANSGTSNNVEGRGDIEVRKREFLVHNVTM